MNKNSYMNLPDLMLKDDIQKLFIDLLSKYINGEINDDDFIDYSFSLSNVEIFDNELIDIRLRNILDNIILKNCNYDNIRNKEGYLLHIIVNFQLINSLNKIKSSVDYWFDKDIRFYNNLKYFVEIAEKDLNYMLSLDKSR